jgi:hypothetical protein
VQPSELDRALTKLPRVGLGIRTSSQRQLSPPQVSVRQPGGSSVLLSGPGGNVFGVRTAPRASAGFADAMRARGEWEVVR